MRYDLVDSKTCQKLRSMTCDDQAHHVQLNNDLRQAGSYQRWVPGDLEGSALRELCGHLADSITRQIHFKKTGKVKLA